MKRRDFIKITGAAVAGATLSFPSFLSNRLRAQETAQSIVSIAEGTDYSSLAKSALEPLGGLQKFINKGDRVVIKPNIGWDREPEQAATTNPEIVKSLALMALACGASRIMVFDRTCNDNRRCYVNSGIQTILESLKDDRIEVSFIDDRKFVPIQIAKGLSVTEWDFYKDAMDAECYINVPIAKQHGLSGLTLGMKNIMGVIGGVRGKIHHAMGQRLADLNTVLRPKINIIDATRLLLRNGPQGGNLSDVKVQNMVIASTDMIAADAYATTLFGLKPEEISSTVSGYKMGLGEIDTTKIKIIKT